MVFKNNFLLFFLKSEETCHFLAKMLGLVIIVGCIFAEDGIRNQRVRRKNSPGPFFGVSGFKKREEAEGFNDVFFQQYMDVSENSGTPKSSILIGFSIINHRFWGTPIFGNTHIMCSTSNKENMDRIPPNRVSNTMQIKEAAQPCWGTLVVT